MNKPKTIFGITGTLGAGKGAIVAYLQTKGFRHYSARAFITEEIKRRGLPVNRDTMTEVGNSLRKEHGSAYVIESLIKEAEASGSPAIIESVRTVGEVRALKKKGGILLSVDADPKIRYERVIRRGSETDAISFEKFIADEERESTSEDPGVQNLKKTAALADVRIMNNGTLPSLHRQIDVVFATVGRT